MEVWNPKHPHHAVWREYTQSLMDGKPKVVEMRTSNGWVVMPKPSFKEEYEYRIARPMLKLSYEVPMPVTEALGIGDEFWCADDVESPNKFKWRNELDTDMAWLRAGLVYLTEADAQAAIDARNAAVTAALEG